MGCEIEMSTYILVAHMDTKTGDCVYVMVHAYIPHTHTISMLHLAHLPRFPSLPSEYLAQYGVQYTHENIHHIRCYVCQQAIDGVQEALLLCMCMCM